MNFGGRVCIYAIVVDYYLIFSVYFEYSMSFQERCVRCG